MSRRLGDLCSQRKELIQPSRGGLNRYVGLEHLDPGFARLRRWGTDAGLRSTKARFRPGDVLYGKLRPYLGKAALAEWEGVCSTDILVLEPKPGETDAAFLSFLLHSPDLLAHAVATTSGVNHPRTDWNSIAAFEQPVPAPTEQRAIGDGLSKLLSAVELEDRVVAMLKELKAATMAKLFREGLLGEPLKQTEIGEIPESWQVVSLGDHCRITSGGTPSRQHPEYWGGTVSWVKTSEVNYRPIKETEEYITESGLVNSAARLLPPGTLLMAMYGQGVTRGRVAFLDIEAATNQACAALHPDDDLDSGFLYAYLSFAYERIRELGHGSNQLNLSGEIIRKIKIPLPPTTEEQRALYSVVGALDSALGVEERRRKIRFQVFQLLLRALVTGGLRMPGSHQHR